MEDKKKAQILSVIAPLALLGGAYIGQYGFGLYPCEMCWWQRYPHFIALGFAGASFFSNFRQVFLVLAGMSVITSGIIGGFHAGIEYSWWQGITGCSTLPSGIDVMNPATAPLIRCDVAPWTLFGISLAGFNFMISSTGGIAILAFTLKNWKNSYQ